VINILFLKLTLCLVIQRVETKKSIKREKAFGITMMQRNWRSCYKE